MFVTCEHKDRKHYAKGLCSLCWKSPRMATCHPDQPYCAKGLCRNCYTKMSHMRTGAWRKRKYGLTPKQFSDLVVAQNAKCAICDNTVDGALHVDHQHVTKIVRGLLCGKCNRGIGMFMDDPATLRKAAAYLVKF